MINGYSLYDFPISFLQWYIDNWLLWDHRYVAFPSLSVYNLGWGIAWRKLVFWTGKTVYTSFFQLCIALVSCHFHYRHTHFPQILHQGNSRSINWQSENRRHITYIADAVHHFTCNHFAVMVSHLFMDDHFPLNI